MDKQTVFEATLAFMLLMAGAIFGYAVGRFTVDCSRCCACKTCGDRQ